MKPLPAGEQVIVAELLGEVVATRTRLSRHLVALDHHYALRHLAVRAIRVAHRPECEAWRIREAARGDLVPLAIIVLSVTSFVLAGNRSGRDILARLGGAVAALQHLARQFGFVSKDSAPSPPV